MQKKKPVKISTKRLVLRPLKIEDAPRVAYLANNYQIYRNTLNLPYPYRKEDAEMWILRQMTKFDNNETISLGISYRLTNELVGVIGLYLCPYHENGEIGYWIGKDYRNKGFATEAVLALIDYAFGQLNYYRVYGKCFASNPASAKVLEKVGMTFEGELKGHIKKEDIFEDVLCYGIINPNYY